jgi:hypothetical protein
VHFTKYYSGDQIGDKMGWPCSTHQRDEKCIQYFGLKTWKRQLGRRRHKWKDSVRMDLRDVGWEGVDWIHLAQHGDQWWAVSFHKRQEFS